MGSHQALREVLEAEDREVDAQVRRIASDFIGRGGRGVLWRDIAAARAAPDKPRVLLADWNPAEDIQRDLLELAGCVVFCAWNGRVMLAKMMTLRPRLLVTGLNVLHAYPPSYRWMISNAFRPRGIPTLVVTGAGAWRLPLEVPASPRVRVLSKGGFHSHAYHSAVRELLRLSAAT